MPFKRTRRRTLSSVPLKAGGVGLNLTQADYVFIIDPWWNPAAESQAIARAHRIGQKDSVNCYYLLGRRTIDQKLYRIIEEKKHISNAVLGAEDNIQTNIVDMMANLFDTNEEEE